MRIFLFILIIFLPFISYAREIPEPSVEFMPYDYIVNINENEKAKFKLFTTVQHPDTDMFLNGIKNINIKVIRTKDKTKLEDRTFININQFMEYSYKPEEVGRYLIDLKVEMGSGIIYEDDVSILAVEIPGVTEYPIYKWEFKPSGSFEIEIPIPDVVYKALDLAFVIDNSISMKNEISATKSASKYIFSKLKELTGDVKGSVITFSDYNRINGVYNKGNYNLIIPPTSNPDEFKNISTGTTGGNEFQFFALYRTAQYKELWREGAVKLLVLMTDEHDNVYCNKRDCDFKKEIEWLEENQKINLSVENIISFLSRNDFSATILYNGIDGDAYYGNIMRSLLKNKFGGIYRIPNNPHATEEIVNNLYNSLYKLIRNAVIFITPLGDEKNMIKKIEPVMPQQCIDETHKGFKYECAKKKGDKVKYKITMDNKRLYTKRYNFLLTIMTDKGSLVAVQPVSLYR